MILTVAFLISFDPSSAICQSQPYGTKQDGWRRLDAKDNAYVTRLVTMGKAQKSFPQTLECMYLGEKIYLRELWWRLIPVKQGEV